MPKKRKTRKEKEVAAKRRISSVAVTKVPSAPLYSVKITDHIIKPSKSATQTQYASETSKIGIAYLMQDIRNITAAAGLVVAFDIVLFVLLQNGIIRLPMFGY